MSALAASIVCNDYSLSNIISIDYLSGFVMGFAYNDHRAELATCFNATKDFQAEFCKSVASLNIQDGLIVNEVIKMIT